MPVALIERNDGGVSLDLGAGDLDGAMEAVSARLGVGPPVVLERAALYDVVEDPCLISISAGGARLLRRIYQALAPERWETGVILQVTPQQ